MSIRLSSWFTNQLVLAGHSDGNSAAFRRVADTACGTTPVAPLITGHFEVNDKELGLLEGSAVPLSSKISALSSPSGSDDEHDGLVPYCWSVVLGWLAPSVARTWIILLSCGFGSIGGNSRRGIGGSRGECLEELIVLMDMQVFFLVTMMVVLEHFAQKIASHPPKRWLFLGNLMVWSSMRLSE